MNAILLAHNKLWFAAKARNWPLAEYEPGGIKEAMGEVRDLVPVFDNLPLAGKIDTVIAKEIADLEKAITAKDLRQFAAGYDKLNQACNACHQSTGHGFVVIERPARAVFTDQDYQPRQ